MDRMKWLAVIVDSI
jgi:gamma-tubulin complex component 3